MARKEESTGADNGSDGANKGVLSRLMSVVTGGSSEKQDIAPKATDLLKTDHDDVRALFKQYEGASEGAKSTRKRLIDEICRALGIHAQMEEKIFYPACKSLRDADARKMVGESLEEHLIVKRLIKDLSGLTTVNEVFEAKSTVLRELVEHHAGEEERDLFPVAEKELGDERLQRLGLKMSKLKARLGTRQPLSAARSGTARKAAPERKRSH